MGFAEIKDAYWSGDREKVLAAYAENPHLTKSSGETLLHYACSYADADALAYLLGEGLDPNAKEQRLNKTPLHYLAVQENRERHPKVDTETRRCADLLLKAGARVIYKDADGCTALMAAAQRGLLGLVEAIVQSGGRLAFTDHNGDNALHLACRYAGNWVYDLSSRNSDTRAEAERILEEYFLCVKALVDAGMDVEEKNGSGETPLDIAVASGAKKIGAFLNGTLGEDGKVPSAGGMNIYQAVEKGDCEAIRDIAESGCMWNEAAEEGRFKGLTPLGIACETAQPEVVKLLLQLGADPSYKNAGGNTAVASLFEFYGGRYFTRDVKGPVEIFHALIEAGMDKDGSVNDQSDSPLLGACRKISWGQSREIFIPLAEELLAMGADPNRSDLDGVTPLMLICKSNCDLGDFPLTLLDAGADCAAADKAGNTPLHYAAMNRADRIGLEMAQCLFDFGPGSVEAVNNDGKTALDLAAEGNHESLVKLILTHS